MVSVLITDGGPHPPAKWAQVTAEHLIRTDSPLAQQHIAQTLRLRADVMDILVRHHEAAQQHERRMLQHDRHFDMPHDSCTDFLGLLREIQAAASGTVWQAHLARDDVIQAIHGVVHEHTTGLRHVERLWHAEGNPSEAAQAYRARHALT